MRTLLVIVILYALIQNPVWLVGQTGFSKIIHTPDGNDLGWGITWHEGTQTASVVTGSICQEYNIECTKLYNFSATGEENWQSTFDDGPREFGSTVVQAVPDGYLVQIDRIGEGQVNRGLLKVDLSGDSLWYVSYADSAILQVSYRSILELPNGNYLLDGGIQEREGDMPINTVMLIVSPQGELLHRHIMDEIFVYNYISDVEVDQEGNIYYMYVGRADGSLKDTPVVCKYDSSFNEIFCHWHSQKLSLNTGVRGDIVILDNGSYAMVWFDEDPGAPDPRDNALTVEAYNSFKQRQWRTEFLLSDADNYELELSAGGYIYGCGSKNIASNEPLYEYASHAGWMFKMDQQGNVIWDKTYLLEQEEYRIYQLFDLVVTDEEVVYASGFTDNRLTSPSSSDIWLLKVDENGCIDSNCDSTLIITSAENTPPDNPKLFDVVMYPNPVDDVLYIRDIDLLIDGIKIHDHLGRCVFTERFATTSSLIQINTTTFSTGVYSVSLYSRGRLLGAKNISVVR